MDTVRYGMPPEGYESVTLPNDLVQELDGLDLGSPTGAIRHLLAEYRTDNTPATDGVELGDLREQLDRIESAASTAEERTGSIENTLDNMGGR